jgi:hypothetical protein
MKPQCVAAVNRAALELGREGLTDAELRAIDDRLSSTMRRLARQDPAAWRALPMDERVSTAAEQVVADLQAEAARKVENAQRQVLATAATEQRVGRMREAYQGIGRSQALVREMETTGFYIDGVKREAIAGLVDTIDAAGSSAGMGLGRRAMMFLFDAENPAMSRDLVAEIFSGAAGSTGNKLAKAGARAWLDTIEQLRQRFNAAGGDVGRLDYGYLPQPHDTARVRAAGADAWAQRVLPMLDRSRYVLDDGTMMNDAQVLDFLRASWETIASDGLNKLEPGQFRGTGARANRGSESRQIHFRDGEAFMGYMRDFGAGTVYDAMVGHIAGISRDIGLVERYGPNPNAQIRLQTDLARKVDGGIKRTAGNLPEAYWRVLNGTSVSPESAQLAQIAQTTRNVQTFAKLAGALLSSITDLGTLFVTTGYNRLGYFEALRNAGRVATSGETRDFLTAHGVIAESLISDLNRWSGDNVRHNWSGRLANATMRLSLLNAWTDSLRRGFSLTMMQGLGRLSKTEWGALTEWDRSHLTRKGITEDDWGVITRAELTEYRGAQHLTPEAIAASGDPRAAEVSAKVLGLITDESEYAVINPDLATKAIQSWGGEQTGTIKGELARSVMHFKSFPIAMITRHWRRMFDIPPGMDGAPALASRKAYTGALLVSLTALGAVAFQTKQVVQGKDPVDMTRPKFWLRAFTQGGGAGFLGDVLLRDSTDDTTPQQGLFELLGPTAGSLAQLYELTKGNLDEAAAGKDTHAGAEALRFARGHLPFVNLWYAKRALDAAGLHALQENLSPGYLARIKKKALKDWGQDYWWAPGEAAPDRAPDLSAVGGP